MPEGGSAYHRAGLETARQRGEMSDLIPRLAFDDMAAEIRGLLAPRVQRLGYLGEFFRCTACQPRLLGPFMEMTEALNQVLPKRLVEVGALTVAGVMDNAYERHQHEQLCVKLGYDRAWVAQVNACDPDHASLMDAPERAVQSLALAMLAGHGHGAAPALAGLCQELDPAGAVAVMFLVGRYVTHALIVNTLALAPPVASISAAA